MLIIILVISYAILIPVFFANYSSRLVTTGNSSKIIIDYIKFFSLMWEGAI